MSRPYPPRTRMTASRGQANRDIRSASKRIAQARSTTRRVPVPAPTPTRRSRLPHLCPPAQPTTREWVTEALREFTQGAAVGLVLVALYVLCGRIADR